MNDLKPFFVTGMPRSRTAWLAAWLTTDKTICYHDPRGITLEVLQERNPGRRVGISGPETCLLFEQYPTAPWVIVQRDSTEALKSFLAVCQKRLAVDSQTVGEFWYQRRQLLAKMSFGHRNVLNVPFEGLNQLGTARTVWEHLLPGTAFDAERWQLLNGLNIQQIMPERKD